MIKCPFCYQTVDKGIYHTKCCKKMFGITELPTLTLNKELLNDLAKATVNNRIAVTGVQPKLSVELEDVKGSVKRLVCYTENDLIIAGQKLVNELVYKTKQVLTGILTIYYIHRHPDRKVVDCDLF